MNGFQAIWCAFICFWAGFIAGHEWSIGWVIGVHLMLAIALGAHTIEWWWARKEKRPGL